MLIVPSVGWLWTMLLRLPKITRFPLETLGCDKSDERPRPDYHVDISSIVNFSAIVSAFIPVDFYEYRPASVTLSNFHSGKADLLRLPFSDMSLGSVSCMHVIEHIGLGRYGEALDPDGHLKAIRELVRVLAAGGNL